MERDYKRAASGEADYETSEPNEMQEYASASLTPSHEKAVWEALFLLQKKMLIELTDDETRVWEKELSKVPAWKLGRVGEFAGTNIREIWKFFADLQLPPETRCAPALPKPKSKIATDFFAHVKALGNAADFRPTVLHENDPIEYAKQRAVWLAEHRAAEKKGLEAQHAKYPSVGFDRTMRAREFMKIIEPLKAAQQSLAEAVHAGAGEMDAEDEAELRYWLQKMPGIIGRAERSDDGVDAMASGKEG